MNNPEQMPLATRVEVLPDLAESAKPVSVNDILMRAVDRGVAVDVLERLVALKERIDAADAKRAFVEAMAAFKRDCPPVPRRTVSDQFSVTKNGVKRPRKYAALDDIAATINEPAARNGLSYRWSDAEIVNSQLKMSCIVSHVGGHSEASSASVPIDSKAGCSDQQKMGTAMTYTQRYSLISAFGLTSCDEDTDGEDGGDTITDEQAADIAGLIAEVKANEAAFLAVYGVKRVADLPASVYKAAVKMLEAKRR